MTSETGGAIQSFSRSTERKFNFVYDAGVGYTTGFVAHDPKATYDIELILTGSTGVALASPGVTLSLANTTTGNGVAAGGVYTQTTALRHAAEDFRKFTVNAFQYPGIA
jgi:hypothetical protein